MPESTSYATLSLARRSGGPDLTTVPPFALVPGGAGGLIDSGRAALVARPVRVEVSMLVPVPPGLNDVVRLTVGAHAGATSASATVDLTLDLIPPEIYAAHSTRTDESADDQLLNRVCVEVNEPLVRIELACNGSWLGPVPAGQPERITLKKRHAVFCLNSQPVPSGCTRLTAQVTDQSGNVSAPYDFGDLRCSIRPSSSPRAGAERAGRGRRRPPARRLYPGQRGLLRHAGSRRRLAE